MSKLFTAIDKRRAYFKDMLDEKSMAGIYQCFIRAGMDENKLSERNITYRMVEKVLFDLKSYYPVSFLLITFEVLTRL